MELNCKICFDKFNTTTHKPMTVMLCGHTFCSKCLNELKKIKKNFCPTCREEIISEKPNYAMIEAIVATSPNFKINLKNKIILPTSPTTNLKEFEKESEKFFYSNNHEHSFVRITKETTNWSCDGPSIFGRCKLAANESPNKTVSQIRYKCTKCVDFDLCHGCLKAPKLIEFNDDNNEYKSENHEHLLIKLNRDTGWKCDGVDLFGKCKSGLDEYNMSFGKQRYKCKICQDFDLCYECLTAPKIFV